MIQRLEAEGKQNSESKEKWDDGSDHDDVSKIYVLGDNEGISYIRFVYIKNGQPKYESFHAYGTYLGLRQTFEINHKQDEQLESIEGYYQPGKSVIVAIQFKTNLRISELIGYAKDGYTKFSLAVDGKKIIGFHGSSTAYLNSLGAYFTWITPTRIEAKGGNGGKEWNDGYHEGITKIYVRGGYEGIQYIKIDYVKGGQHIYGSAHGMRSRGFTESFEINHSEKEYLVSVEGYYDEGDLGIIQGIQFKTNLKTSEMMGDNMGRKFSLAANGKKIIGFHGFAEKNLNSLGAYFTTSPFTNLEYIDGTLTEYPWDDGTFEGVRKVTLQYDNDYVRFITFDYDNRGKVEKRDHGATGNGGMGQQDGEFVVDYPNEFITSVEGTIADQYAVVASLTFKTSKGRTSSTFGKATNNKFVLDSKGCGLVGFHGRSGAIFFALGGYFRPLPPPPNTERLDGKGGDGGVSWDDGGFDGIRTIYIGHTKMGIAFIKFMYDKNNHVVVGHDHGNNTLLGVDEFELEYPNEYLESVEGSYEMVDGNDSEVILKLMFKTNKRTSQVFGIEKTSNFVLHQECHKIVGFHGKMGKVLHQIGVHVLPINTD